MDLTKHELVPKHSKLSDSEKQKVLDKFTIATKQLPKILITDMALQKLKPKIGDVIKIERTSQTAGKSDYYRVVIDG